LELLAGFCSCFLKINPVLAGGVYGALTIFLDQAEQCGLTHLRGHAAFGGVRASLYNAMPVSGVQQLVDFMSDFEQRHG